MLVSEQTTAMINTMLHCCLCSDKQKVSFVSRSTKDFKNTRPGKALFFAYVFPSKRRVNQRKKIQDNVYQTKISVYAQGVTLV